MSAYEFMRDVYRRTFKRSQAIHRGFYYLAERFFLPFLERYTGFYTSSDDPLYLRMDLLLGKYEAETVKVIKRLVKPGMVALDVGAHVGYYTVTLSRLVGESGKAIAIEPHPVTFQMLVRNTQGLRNVNCIEIAASDVEGVVTLYDQMDQRGGSSLSVMQNKRSFYEETLKSEFSPRSRMGFPTQSYRVRSTTIDSVLSELFIEKVDFIKMDIEGAEINALRGMRETLKRSPHVILVVEFAPTNLQAFGFTPRDAVKEIKSHGFAKIAVIEENGELTPLNDEILEFIISQTTKNFSRVNFLCEKHE